MTTTELFLIHTTHPLWVGCVSASHTSSLLLRPFWNTADCYGREERAWCLKSMVRAVYMAKPDVSGEGQQVFANSNIVYHTLHYTFPPFLWVSAILNIFQSFDIFLSFHLLISRMKMLPGKLLLTLQDPAQISSLCCFLLPLTTLPSNGYYIIWLSPHWTHTWSRECLSCVINVF